MTQDTSTTVGIAAWHDSALRSARSHGLGGDLAAALQALPAAYKLATPPPLAIIDLAALRDLTPHGLGVHIDDWPDVHNQWRLRLQCRSATLTLSQIVPVLHGLGFEVLHEQAHAVPIGATPPSWIHDIGIRIPSDAELPEVQTLTSRVRDTIEAVWNGDSEADNFNALVTHCGLNHRYANLMRAYARYLRQLNSPQTTTTMQAALREYAPITAQLVSLFTLRFDPDREPNDRDYAAAMEAVTADISAIASADADRVLRAFLTCIQATVRTNFYCPTTHGPRPALALKLDTTSISFAPPPRPAFEIFVYAPHVEGVHLRFGKVARGGLRWSDRRDDYRTEILDLAKAQTVKNAVIVPAGAKGGFIAKDVRSHALSSQENPASQTRGSAAYRSFIAALLSVTDNVDSATHACVSPPRVLAHDGDDAYLVVAADKGTAAFSDVANAVADDHDFWLGDAFASGGSIGYDHKKMGITARGAWQSVVQHFRELDHDVTIDTTTVIGIGDMSGDVFGNGMLLSRQLKLIAAFDHRHIFVDPNPDPETSYMERSRLFGQPESTWAEYDSAKISRGGFIAERSAKTIPLTAEARQALGIDHTVTDLTPTDLISAILRAPVDLLWNGGIGTYVKASDETHAEVGDRHNDAVRIDALDLRARVVGEGGNLGVTQRGRIQYARAGGRINTDALDNSAGVDCSDHEVNIKIVLDTAVRAHRLDRRGRAALLEAMTDDVADLVLANNRGQNELLSAHRDEASETVALHARMTASLRAQSKIDPSVVLLPSTSGFAALAKAGAGLTSPELAQLCATAKLAISSDVAASPSCASAAFAARLLGYFPPALVAAYPDLIENHPLRADIIATAVTNEMVDRAGATFAYRLHEEFGTSGSEAATAFVCASDIFDVGVLVADLRAAEDRVCSAAINAVRTQLRRLVDRAARWLLTNRPQPLALDAQITRYRERVRDTSPQVRAWLGEREESALRTRIARLEDRGAPPRLAAAVAELLHTFCLLDICDIADITGIAVERVGPLYFAISERLNINHYLTAVTSLPRLQLWDSLSRQALREDLYVALRAVVLDALADYEDHLSLEDNAAAWAASNRTRLARALRLMPQLTSVETQAVGLPQLAVAARRIRSVVRSPQPV